MAKNIYKPKPVSGFPEWLPDVRMVEQQWLDHIRRVFESYGYCSIETPAVEELDVIRAKGGDADNEIYVLERLHKEENDKEARLALHFDQTVPLARYVAQHFNELVFPFKRYQIQKVWRGERPQAGRFREFYQCDIDAINVDSLPLHFDAEMPAIIWEILAALPGMENEKIQIQVSNRKILMGLMAECEIQNTTVVTRLIDKLEKIGREKVIEQLEAELKDDYDPGDIEYILRAVEDGPQALRNADHPLIKEGLEELDFVMKQLSHLPEGAVVADLSIVRGLDYYTGTVYETRFLDDPTYGSICSGGRYDDLAGNYIAKHLPGVGISIGFSRLFERLHKQGKLPAGRQSPADIYVVLPNEEQRDVTMKTAATLRERGFNVEMAHGGKLKKQLAYAEKKMIPFVWLPPFESGLEHEIKNMATGEQTKTKPELWGKSTDLYAEILKRYNEQIIERQKLEAESRKNEAV